MLIESYLLWFLKNVYQNKTFNKKTNEKLNKNDLILYYNYNDDRITY